MAMKDKVKELLVAYASPAPYLVRNNWEPIAEYGASRPALANVARNYYGNAINNILGNVNNQYLANILNDARNRNLEYQRLNAMQYGGYPMYPVDRQY